MSAVMTRHDGLADPAASLPSGFCSGTVFETGRGSVDVAALRAGDVLRCASGEMVPVAGVLSFGGAADWVCLPGRGGEVAVAPGQPLLCRHFLVAALFGAAEAVLRAGDVTGPGVRRPGGSRSLHLPLLSAAAVVSIGGYEFPFYASPAGGSRSGEKGRAGGDGLDGGRGPHPGLPLQEHSPPARVLLGPAQVRQLCEAGVLFRGAAR